MKLTALLAGACVVASFATGIVFADPITATRFVPERHGADICIDTPLSLTFTQPPLQGDSGAIRVYRSDGTLVDSVDVAELLSAKAIGGAMIGGNPYLFNYYPVTITGSRATIYLHRSLDYGQTYYVLIDPGVFT